MDSSEHFGAEIRVTLTDGRVLTQKVRRAVGRSTDDPLPVELLEAKFLNCASRALSAGASRGLLTLLRGLESVTQISSVTQAMLPPTALAAD